MKKRNFAMIKKLFIGVSLLVSTISFGQHLPGDTTTAEVPIETVQLFAPNAFTADGNYFNDTWKIYIEGIDIYYFHLTIFNRNGEIIWESYNTAGEWDGSYGYQLAPAGIYPYRIETKDSLTDKRYVFTGFITLIR